MVDTYKKLAQLELTGGTDTIYTVPAATEAIIAHIRAVDNAGNGASIKLWHDGVADVNIILPEVSLPAGGWAEFDGKILMEAADTLSGFSNTASEVTVTVYGLEVS